MKMLGYLCGASIWVAIFWPVLAKLDINPWWSPFVGLVVTGPILALWALVELLAKRAGALDVKSRAEQRLTPEQAAEGFANLLGETRNEQAPGTTKAAPS